MEAALATFSRRGFAGSTLDQVAERAGVTKGTIYRYFPDKESLFIETLRWKIGSVFPGLSLPSRVGSAEQLLGQIVRSALLLCHEQEFLNVVALLIGEANRFPAVAKRYYREVILVLNQAVASAVTGWTERGGLRNDLDPLIVGRALVGMVLVFGLSQEILKGKEILAITDEEIVRNIVPLALDGLRSRGSVQSGPGEEQQ